VPALDQVKNAYSCSIPLAQISKHSTLQNYEEQVFLVPIKIVAQEFLSVGTGSSDPCIVESGFKCNKPPTSTIIKGDCSFGPSYKRCSSFSQKPGEKFSIYYSGEEILWLLGIETVTPPNKTVNGQKIAIVNSATCRGDGLSIGLAFPSGSATWSEAKTSLSRLFTPMHRKG
jgi:hypothetical protein